MKSLLLTRLTFHGAVHIGDHRPEDYNTSEEFLHSDTLYAALMAVGFEMQLQFPGEIILSSAFPFCTIDDHKYYFFPKPLNVKLKGEASQKDLKRVSWVDQQLFEQCLSSESCEPAFIHEEFAFSKLLDNPVKPFTKQIRQRVRIPRVRSTNVDAEPFYMEQLQFYPGSGLFFLADVPEKYMEAFTRTLSMLGDQGLGTDRTVGLGGFTFDIDHKWEVKIPPKASRVVTLGLLCPKENELAMLIDATESRAAYSLTKRGGWITTPPHQTIRKKSIYMFTEGSVFSGKNLNRAGNQWIEAGNQWIDLKPEEISTHSIIRNGQCIVLPMI